MPRVRIIVQNEALAPEKLQGELVSLASDDYFMQILSRLAHLIKRGDISIWISPQLMKALKAFAVDEFGRDDVDDSLLLAWLEKGGSIGPVITWEIKDNTNARNGCLKDIRQWLFKKEVEK